MHVTIVKGIVVTVELLAPVLRRIEIVQIGLGQTHLPIAVVRLMIPHNRRHRDRALHLLDPAEELRPLKTILSVVHEIAHAGEKLRIRVARPRKMRELLPVCIVTRLGVGEEQHFVRLVRRRRIEFLPVRRRLARRNAVLVPCPRRQLLKLCRILIDLDMVVCKTLVRRRVAAQDRLRPLHTHLHRLLLHRRRQLPHQGAPVSRVLRDNLPQTLCIEHAGSVAQCRIV